MKLNLHKLLFSVLPILLLLNTSSCDRGRISEWESNRDTLRELDLYSSWIPSAIRSHDIKSAISECEEGEDIFLTFIKYSHASEIDKFMKLDGWYTPYRMTVVERGSDEVTVEIRSAGKDKIFAKRDTESDDVVRSVEVKNSDLEFERFY